MNNKSGKYEFVSAQPNEPMPEQWFYITRRGSSEILFYFDQDGYPVWKPNNFQEFFPYVFTNPLEAQRICDLVKGDAVLSQEYTVTNRSRSIPW